MSFDKSFSDVLEDLDAAFFLAAYARKDRFVVLGDLSYAASSKSGLIPPGLPAEAELRQRSLTLAAGWRAIDSGGLALDVLGGVRPWKIKAEVSVANGAISRSGDKDFVDPIVALRANYTLAPRWSAIAYVDHGVTGMGSEKTTQVLGTVNYQMTDQAYLSVGYRRLDVDYRSGGTRVDATMAGPLLGLTWRF
ncbi:hypothetical protein [Paracoccus benzoatiresistens]|uniref:Outer membrane protein beta-barrel domain-containing protein n=1 Tax=Paracoccus benzoatiresistens TaxID=2997341 RepID=A0ABT4J8Y5_9RHOB|nr:hypothetical protein [Paracoccus sp. EF6]MCZ0963553.1 hypothetical protein [Paracoccus sp. EF6]